VIALLNFAISGLCEARRREFREITRADMKYKIPGEIAGNSSWLSPMFAIKKHYATTMLIEWHIGRFII